MCDIQKLEMIHHRAACFVFNDFFQYSSVTGMINNQQWTTLKLRRDIDKIITIDAYLHSYLLSTIQLWNSLLSEVVHLQSLSIHRLYYPPK